MTDVAAASGSTALSELSAANKFQQELGVNSDLGQEEFLSLMTTQLQNQDPLAPMENGDFIAQLAQFGTVSGIGELQTAFEDLSAALSGTSASDAALLIGRTVYVESDVAQLSSDEPMAAAVQVPEGVTNIQVSIETSSGNVVDSFELADQHPGLSSFKWDGKLADGTTADPARYIVRATATSEKGPETLQTFAGSRVDSVAFEGVGREVVLNISGLGSKPLSEISRIGL